MVYVNTEQGISVFEIVSDDNFQVGDSVKWAENNPLGDYHIFNETTGEIQKVHFKSHWMKSLLSDFLTLIFGEPEEDMYSWTHILITLSLIALVILAITLTYSYWLYISTPVFCPLIRIVIPRI